MMVQYESRIGLGDHVRDTITRIEGVVTCVVFWQYGCIRCNVQPTKLVDGKVVEQLTLDEPQLEIIRRSGEEPPKAKHGPRASVTRAPGVKR